jgi:hypothetical protein
MRGFQSASGAGPVTTSTLPDDLEIAPEYTVGCWRSLKLNPNEPAAADWKTAVAIFDARIRCRFLDPVDELMRTEKCRSRQTFGFAILAIDFLVIETLQGFREGEIDHNGKSKRLIKSFLKQWDAFKNCLPEDADPDTLAKRIYKGYRCALHHSGATDGALRVGISGPVFAFENAHKVKINRTCLHMNLKREFEAYLGDLCAPDKSELRGMFLRKMNAICGLQ